MSTSDRAALPASRPALVDRARLEFLADLLVALGISSLIGVFIYSHADALWRVVTGLLR